MPVWMPRLVAIVLLTVADVSLVRGAAQQRITVPDLKRLTLEELGQIVVTSVTKSPEQVWRTDAAIHVVTSDDIRRSGATSVPDVLRLVPGVQVSRIDSSRWAIGVRGFASQFSRSLLVLVDGRNVYTPLFAGVHWAAQDLVLDDIDRIEVIRGPGGTIWGTNAVNGVINIITKHAAATRGVSVSATGGNVERFSGEFRYGGRRGDTLHYRVSGKAFDRGPQHHPGFGDFDEGRLAQVNVRADWTPHSRDSGTLTGRLYGGQEGKLTGIASYSPPAQVNVDAPDHVSGGHVLAQWRRDMGIGHEMRAQASYEHIDRLGAQFGERRDIIDVDFAHRRSFLGRHTVRWGAGARWSPSTFEQTIPTLDFQPREDTFRVFSAFGQDEITFAGRRGRVTAGITFEHNAFTGWEAQPTGRLLWAFTDRSSAWAAITRAVRIPSRLDRDLELNGLLRSEPLLYLRIAGSRDFDSEQVAAFEGGYRTLVSDRLFVDVAAFRNSYDDLNGIGNATVFSESDPIPHTVLQFPFTNAVEGTTTGFEVAPSGTVVANWSVRGAYSFLHVDLRNLAGIDNAATVAAQEQSFPRHQGSLQSIVLLTPRLELQQTLRVVGALPGQQVPAFEALDLTGHWHVARGIELAAGIRNLVDANHPEFGGEPGLVGIRRSVHAKVTWRP